MSDSQHEKNYSLKDLAEIVTAAVAEAQKQNAAILADALRDSKIPYKGPKELATEQNDITMREQMRETAKQQMATRRFEQTACPHTKGANSLSSRGSDESAFVIHRLDTNETIGICSNCIKIISNRRPEDLVYFQKKGGNTMSSAGHRDFANQAQAIMSRPITDNELVGGRK